MTNKLIVESEPNKVLPLGWRLWGNSVERDANFTAFASNWTDGYMILATMGWAPVDVDNEFGDYEGTIGTCVESLDEDGAAIGSDMGHPTVCHFVKAAGNDVTNLKVVSLTAEQWASGAMTTTPADPGVELPPEAGLKTEKTAFDLISKGTDAVKENTATAVQEEEVETDFEPPSDPEVEADFDLQSGWDDFGKAISDAGQSALTNFTSELIEEGQEFLAGQATANFNWYQPHATLSGAYPGIRRYTVGGNVQAYSVERQMNEDRAFVATP